MTKLLKMITFGHEKIFEEKWKSVAKPEELAESKF